jgi:hypothetical protein
MEVETMSAVKGRKRRPHSDEPTVPLQAQVPPSARIKARGIADALGVSLGIYLEQLLEREELDHLGRPKWWGEMDDPQGKLLDIERAAS